MEVAQVLFSDAKELAVEASNYVACPVCRKCNGSCDYGKHWCFNIHRNSLHEHDCHREDAQWDQARSPDQEEEDVKAKIWDAPVYGVPSANIGELENSDEDLSNERGENELPDFCLSEETNEKGGSKNYTDGLAYVQEIILLLWESTCIKKEIVKSIFKVGD